MENGWTLREGEKCRLCAADALHTIKTIWHFILVLLFGMVANLRRWHPRTCPLVSLDSSGAQTPSVCQVGARAAK